VTNPILINPRRSNCAAISSRRFLAALSISLYRARETLSPRTLKCMNVLLLNEINRAVE
jgi:hypothetical protein